MSHSHEQGFTLIELLIVVVIVAVLMAIAIGSFGSSKSAGATAAATAVAQSYDQAISSFSADHTGKVPVPGVAPDWPNLTQGPLEPNIGAGGATPYIKSVPEQVTSNQVSVVTTPVAPGSTTATPGLVSVRVDRSTVPPIRYRVEIWQVSQRKATKMRCWLGNWDPGNGAAKC